MFVMLEGIEILRLSYWKSKAVNMGGKKTMLSAEVQEMMDGARVNRDDKLKPLLKLIKIKLIKWNLI